ncbi:phytanoyl-CoA dioxygenase family protein [Sphingobium aromaticivastans]|uniref:phytanoyl-CoA dioxygenase family protein n=1 Tax=Sphingobium aromaticivastans TaxID=1778665 RepID=UPI00301639B7
MTTMLAAQSDVRPHQLTRTDKIEEGCRNLEQYGYTIHENFLSADELAALNARLDEQAEMEREQGVATLSASGHAGKDRHFGGVEGAQAAFQQVSFLPNKGRAFRDLMRHPVALAYCDHIFRGQPFNLVTQGALILRAGGTPQVLHADQQAITFPTPFPVMLNVMTCLSDFEAEMGATRIVPGSHLGPSPDMTLERDEAVAAIGGALVPLTARAGSALIWESRTWHCQWASTSPRTRVSIGSVYGVHFVKPQDVYPAIIHDDVYETLSEEEKRLLGFEVAFEYGGRIAPRRPDDTRSNTNARYPYIPELRRGGTKQAVPIDQMQVAHSARLPEATR